VPHGDRLRLSVCLDTTQETLREEVRRKLDEGAVVYTDEATGYDTLVAYDRQAVTHSEGEFARDDDGDGVREVHCNTMEGIWTGLRNMLRRFRGVSKSYLAQYVAMFEWAYNYADRLATMIRAMVLPDFTPEPT
jgi:transposase-like protein